MSEKETYNLGIDIDKDIIESNVTKIVAGAIATALGDKEILVQRAVEKVLTSYVDSDGKPCNRSSYHARPYIQYIAEKVVEDTIRKQIAETIEENKDAFKEAIKKELSKPSVRNKIGSSFIEALLATSKDKWRVPIQIDFEKEKDGYR